ncbi:MAG: TlpA disulfide reductase family protein [Rhodoferax sp.]|nr:TlpA disulfide reductase family protein [Rhodoferax sp.]
MTETNKSPSPSEGVADQTRRRWLLGTVAGAAALGGAGLAWWRYQPHAMVPQVETALWAAEFADLDSKPLAMQALRGKPLLLNFWATWCPPCVEELPLLSAFYQENAAKGWQVLGLAVDQIDPVKRFLVKTPVSFPVAMAGVSGMELVKSLGNLSGGLPFTVVLGSDGSVLHRKMGKVSSEDLRAWAELT